MLKFEVTEAALRS